MKVTEDLTRSVARLARLELTEPEVTAFTRQLGDVLSYVEQLSRVDVGGVEPMMHPFDVSAPLRDDRAVRFSEDGEPPMLAPAPETVDGGYRVPPVL